MQAIHSVCKISIFKLFDEQSSELFMRKLPFDCLTEFNGTGKLLGWKMDKVKWKWTQNHKGVNCFLIFITKFFQFPINTYWFGIWQNLNLLNCYQMLTELLWVRKWSLKIDTVSPCKSQTNRVISYFRRLNKNVIICF